MTAMQTPLSPIDFYILLALADQERHGYGILQAVSDESQGAVTIGPGTLYGAIKRLTAQQWIEVSPRRPKRDDARRTVYYRLTAKGRTAARHHAEHLAVLLRSAVNKQVIAPIALLEPS